MITKKEKKLKRTIRFLNEKTKKLENEIEQARELQRDTLKMICSDYKAQDKIYEILENFFDYAYKRQKQNP